MRWLMVGSLLLVTGTAQAGFIWRRYRAIPCVHAIPADAKRIGRGLVIATAPLKSVFDCGGREMTVTGAHNLLFAAGCSGVTVAGADNVVAVVLPTVARVATAGHDNTIRWDAPAGATVTLHDGAAASRIDRERGLNATDWCRVDGGR